MSKAFFARITSGPRDNEIVAEMPEGYITNADLADACGVDAKTIVEIGDRLGSRIGVMWVKSRGRNGRTRAYPKRFLPDFKNMAATLEKRSFRWKTKAERRASHGRKLDAMLRDQAGVEAIAAFLNDLGFTDAQIARRVTNVYKPSRNDHKGQPRKQAS